MAHDENTLWILSFYRTSEISGALFFGRLAKSMKPGPIQHDMTKHFADESQHAWYWTSCIDEMGANPLHIDQAYQDMYISAAGMPANLMEVLALTQIFEQRVIGQYTLHGRVPGLQAPIKRTLDKIMVDERWHIEWVGKALQRMELDYGRGYIEETLRRYHEADQEVYRQTLEEHAARLDALRAARP
jgi:hypothetical protein